MNNTTDILIVEDSPDDYEACVAALTKEHNLVNPIVWCRTGDDALDYLYQRGEYSDLQSALPSLILLDLNLPGTDGRDVLAQVKNDKALARIPIIIMTSSRDTDDIDACYSAGANSYVVKPVDMDGFIQAIARLRDYWFEIAVLPEPKK